MPDTFPPYTITDENSIILNNSNTSSGTITLNGDAENSFTVYTDSKWTYNDYLKDDDIKDLKILLELLRSLPEDNEIKQMFNAQKAVNTLRGKDEN